MGFTYDPAGEMATTNSLLPASRTANANGSGVDLTGYIGNVMAVIHCDAAGAGTNSTADFKIQDSADNSTFADVSPAIAATQVTTVASVQMLRIDPRTVRRYIRVVFTIGGTASPAFPCAALIVGRKALVGTAN